MRQVRGFTMIEIIVVMAVLGVLAAAVMPLGETVVRSHKERELRRNLTEMRDAIDAYKRSVDQGLIASTPGASGYPPKLAVLVEGVAAKDPAANGRMHYFLRRMPRDPFADSAQRPEDTWLLRSYASPPNQPRPGADVYDIRSSSDQTALDGTPYASW